MKRFIAARVMPGNTLAILLGLLGAAPAVADESIDSGRYLVTIAACNDCHTNNWMETNGQVPEQDWLTGSAIGWRGPWGTTYASNLQLLVRDMSEDAWTVMLATRSERPPMPWMNVNRISEDDARAIYRFIKSLGARGERMPAPVAAGSEPATPYYLLEPMQPVQMQAAE